MLIKIGVLRFQRNFVWEVHSILYVYTHEREPFDSSEGRKVMNRLR